MHEGSRRAIGAALLANLGIALAKLVAFAVTGAASMLAEAIHSVADTGNQGLLFLGSARARREPDAHHAFGFGRERYFWAFIVAVILFSLGGLFAMYEGISKLIHPHALDSPAWAFGVLGVAILLEGTSLRTAMHAARSDRGDGSWWAFIRTSKNPELPVVLLEDTGALAGLVLALTGVLLATITGEETFDALGSVGIGLLLVVVAVVLATEMKSLLIGESASPETEAVIRRVVDDSPEVGRLIHLRTQHLGPDELLVALKVDLGPTPDGTIPVAIDRIEARIRDAVPSARLIYLEPDDYRPPAP